MNTIIKLISLTFTLLLAIACEQESLPDNLLPSNVKKEVNFSATQMCNETLTKATDVAFEAEDEIGIFVVKRTDPNVPGTLLPSGNYADNKLYLVDNNGEIHPYRNSDKIYIAPGDVYDFYAFYPYQNIQNIQNPFSVSLDQSVKLQHQVSDLMYAKVIGVKSSSNNVNLVFHHLMALIELHFKKEREFTVADVSLLNCKYQSNVNIQTGEVSNVNNMTSIKMYKYGETAINYIYRVLVPEQTLKENEQIFKVKRNDNSEMIYKGKGYSYAVGGNKTIFPCNAQYKLEAFSYYKDWGDVSESNGTYNHGDMVTVTAYPKAGYEFSGWYSSLDGTNKIISYAQTYTFPIINDTYLGASFSPKRVLITVNVNTLGGGVGGEIKGGTGMQEVGKKNTLIATPFYLDKGYVFLGFFDEKGSLVSDRFDYEFIVPGDNLTLEARFEKQYSIINYSSPQGGNLSASVDGSSAWGNGTLFKNNTYCSVRALPPYGYEFQGWYENNSLVSSSAVYRFYVTTDRNLVAQYRPKTYNIQLSDNNDSWINGKTQGGGSFYYGYQCTVKATLSDEYCRFLGWHENNILVNNDMNYSFTVTADRALQAKFDHAIEQGETGQRMVMNKYFNRYRQASTGGHFLEAGTKIQSNVIMGYKELEGNYLTPYTIINTLEIKCDGEILFISSHPEDYTFTIPKDGYYNFDYYMTASRNFINDETVTLWGTWHFFVWKN